MNTFVISLFGIVAIVSGYPNKDFETTSYEDSIPSPSHGSPNAYIIDRNIDYNEESPIRNTHTKTQVSYKKKNAGPNQFKRGEATSNNELEEEKEEPDRLSLLLPQSKFICNDKNTGYYADENLGCEVFHYCQDNAKHSWICPDGFTFHQVHLICMPPGGDNICEKSSNYHFVNNFLYKPVNLEEYQTKPNISLRYSDRYFPDTYRQNYNDNEDESNHHQHSVRVVDKPNQSAKYSTFRPQTSTGQVFRSPEEINISLQQRRPQYATVKYDDYK